MPLDLAATALLAGLLAAVTVIDLRTQRIPDSLNAVLALSGLAYAWLRGDPFASAIGAVAGYGVIALVNTLFRVMRGKDGIGMGDAKLLAGLGAWLGWQALPFVGILGSTAGLAVVAARSWSKGDVRGDTRLAFGPYLAAAGFAVWVATLWVNAGSPPAR